MNKDIQNENYDLNFSEFYELYLNAVDITKGVKKSRTDFQTIRSIKQLSILTINTIILWNMAMRPLWKRVLTATVMKSRNFSIKNFFDDFRKTFDKL